MVFCGDPGNVMCHLSDLSVADLVARLASFGITEKIDLITIDWCNFDCNYTFPIDLAANGIPFGAKSI